MSRVVDGGASFRGGFCARVVASLNGQRIGVAFLVALLLAFGNAVDPALLDFFSRLEIALAWAEQLVELLLIAAALLVAHAIIDEALPRSLPLRLPLVCLALLACSALISLLLHAYYAGGLRYLPSGLRIAADSLHWGVPAVFLAWIADLHARALRLECAEHEAEAGRAELQQAEAEQRLAVLQAQIEPHFLFNVLESVRRLYRTVTDAGAQALESLMRYLREALPQVRSARATLDAELAVVRAYLELFRVRMGPQFDYSIAVPTGLEASEFPPMLLMTLVENAVKHGIAPAGGGHIEIVAAASGGRIDVRVLDDGVGFGAAASSGTGVGLANVRRQLRARYGAAARLVLEGREPRGACASISIPRRRLGEAAAHAAADCPA